MSERYDPEKVTVGSVVHIAEPYGWSSMSVRDFTVEKVTPGGQATVKCGEMTLRINKNGKIVGDDVWCKRRVVTPEKAAIYRAELAKHKWWLKISSIAAAIEKATHKHDEAALRAGIDDLAKAMSARQGQDPQGLGATPASAVPEGNLP